MLEPETLVEVMCAADAEVQVWVAERNQRRVVAETVQRELLDAVREALHDR